MRTGSRFAVSPFRRFVICLGAVLMSASTARAQEFDWFVYLECASEHTQMLQSMQLVGCVNGVADVRQDVIFFSSIDVKPEVLEPFAAHTVKAVCRYPIDCNHNNLVFEWGYSQTIIKKYCLSVAVEAGFKAGFVATLLSRLGLQADFTVTGQACAETQATTSVNLTLTQQDCLDTNIAVHRQRSRVEGTEQFARELIVWTLNASCGGGTIETLCDSETVTGFAEHVRGYTVGTEFEACCDNLLTVPPCCGRVCPP